MGERPFKISGDFMKKSLKVFLLLLFFLFGNRTLASSYCAKVFRILGQSHRPAKEIPSLKVGTFNLLDFGPKKNGDHVKAIANAIRENNPDILALQEVQNFEFLQDFVNHELGGKYDILMTTLPEKQSIQNAFLVKRDLPFIFDIESHAHEMWRDPTKEGNLATALFPRDVPVLKVMRPEDHDAQPFLLMMGTHLKSKMNRNGDHESRILRKAQAERAAEIIGRYQQKFGGRAAMMMLGDFNGNVLAEPEYVALRNTLRLSDALAVEPVPSTQLQRVTHVFQDRNGQMVRSQIDYVLLDAKLRAALIEGDVYRYKDKNGITREVPQNLEARAENPSDHFPYFVQLHFQQIYSQTGRQPQNFFDVEGTIPIFRSEFLNRVNSVALPAL